jgi:hypothetical protein
MLVASDGSFSSLTEFEGALGSFSVRIPVAICYNNRCLVRGIAIN